MGRNVTSLSTQCYLPCNFEISSEATQVNRVRLSHTWAWTTYFWYDASFALCLGHQQALWSVVQLEGGKAVYTTGASKHCKQPRHSPSESFWVATSRPKMPFGSASAYVLPVSGQNRSSDELEGLLTRYIIIPAVLNIFPLYATVLTWWFSKWNVSMGSEE